MRIVAARFNHETNTFSPVKTPLEAFGAHFNEAALIFGRGSNTAFGAFVAYAEAKGAELVTPLAATANPSGPVEDTAFETLAGAIIAAVRAGCDAILLDLHGAMVTRSFDDGEGELLARIRAVAPGVPLGVALDLHGNITEKMVENSDVLVGFKTYPHIDMAETGRTVASLVDRMLTFGLKPHIARVHPPMLAHTLRMNTAVEGAMADLVGLARAAEARPGVLAVTLFGGFPIADIADTGLSIVALAASEGLARDTARGLAEIAWGRRAEFIYTETPLAEALEQARKAAEAPGPGPVLLLDHGDNCMSGGTCDTMDVLSAALAMGFEGIVAGPIADPEAVAALWQAGVGATVSIEIGNKMAAEGFAPPAAPLMLEGAVTALGPGDYVVSGPIYTGQLCHMGRAAVLDTGAARVLVTEQPHEPWDLAVFTSVGIDPGAARYLVLKSRMYCRPVFEPLSRATIECASGGVTSSNYARFAFKKLARPIYPIDPDMRWPSA